MGSQPVTVELATSLPPRTYLKLMGSYSTVSATVSASSRRHRSRKHGHEVSSALDRRLFKKETCSYSETCSSAASGSVTPNGSRFSYSRSRASSVSSYSESDSDRSPTLSRTSETRKIKKIAYVRTWEDSFGPEEGDDELWVVVDLKLVERE